MTKASDNEFPSVLFDEQGSDPSTPASGFWRLYFKATGLFAIDDAASVTGPFGAGGGGIDTGTSFPGSPANNDIFYRTDRDLLYFYDGTRWLTVAEYSNPLTVLDTLAPQTSNGAILYGPIDQGANGCWVTRSVINTIQLAGDGSNHWSMQLQSRPASGAASNVGGAVSTNGNTNGNRVRVETTIAAAVNSAHADFVLTSTETGSTASLYPMIVVYYRLIG